MNPNKLFIYVRPKLRNVIEERTCTVGNSAGPNCWAGGSPGDNKSWCGQGHGVW